MSELLEPKEYLFKHNDVFIILVGDVPTHARIINRQRVFSNRYNMYELLTIPSNNSRPVLRIFSEHQLKKMDKPKNDFQV